MTGFVSSVTSGSTATWAPMKPTLTFGFCSLMRRAHSTSLGSDGVLVCMITRSCPTAVFSTSSVERPWGAASTSVLPGTSAAGWASQVGYQNDVTSRFAWYRAPAPPSNPSNDGGLRNRVFTALPFGPDAGDSPRAGRGRASARRNPAQMIEELRHYVATPGNRDALLARFKNDTM